MIYDNYEAKTSVTYRFENSIPQGTLLNVPFPFKDNGDIHVKIDGYTLSRSAWEFDTPGTIRLLWDAEGYKATVYRNTPLPKDSPVLEEIKDDLHELQSNIEKAECRSGRLVGKAYEKLQKSLETKIQDKTEEGFNAVKVIIKANWEVFNNFRKETEAELKGLNDRDRSRILDIRDLRENYEEQKDSWRPSFDTLSRDLNAAVRVCIDGISELREENGELKRRLLAEETKLCECPSKPTEPEVTGEDLAELKKLLSETRSALNIETQTRRREDAQLKVLLKRLLNKFEVLEDYIAGNDPDLSGGVINELRREMRTQDDTLGRTHLETLVRLLRLKESV